MRNILGKFEWTNDFKNSNRQRVLNCIRLNQPISRTDIVDVIGVSKSTVTRVVEELINDSIIEEAGMGKSTAGRRPVYLKLKDDAYLCIGVNISPQKVSVSVVDLGENIISKCDFDMIKQKTIPDWFSFIEKLKKCIKTTISKKNIDSINILGIGIGIPVVIENNQIVLFDYKQQEYLKKNLESEFKLPVFIDKNPNTRMFGEVWYGFGKGFKNILYVVLGEGIGLGVLSNGEVIKGNNNIAGEFGHTTAVYKGRDCVCGKKGCLEAYSSVDSIEKIYKKKTNRFKTFKEISNLSTKGDKISREIINQSMILIAMKISDLIYLYNPEAVIFTGEFLEYNKKGFNNLVSQVKDLTLVSFLEELKFYHRELHTDLYSIGAAALVYKDFFG